ncbi:class I SAM-dependent methyltransferase [Aurantiacibacter poecillastricola]|uniref:class I SAM-dependent methyltransferase n=1 Tax=Aurantiacibacter poecillastricola TaxID=3064385 RepID=UPI00273EB56A|nr:SAM-dependent methyltransferase [Aurantiacibacter sp. 219JJ12-13]MDP5260784.1 SAM-dependent methyltransferase [Aurantiacibacter sp. 219JJ12-13]
MSDLREEDGRRDLGDTFRRLIASTGPISLMHFMGESNLRYYNDRKVIGAPGEHGGDFITAPEISQMFGELIGLWLADLWIRAGRTEPVHYVELGPGRGTLAADAQRAMKRYALEPRMHLVEGSRRLRDEQQARVPGAIHHRDLSTVPLEGPILLVANEFLDAMPVRQLVKTANGWREIMVAVDAAGNFVETPGRQPMDSAVPEARRSDPAGTVIETSPAAATIMFEVAGRLAKQGGAALFIDYGYTHGRSGSTLQAVKDHRKIGVLDAPGDADITAHVDFAQMEQIARSRNARVMGTVTQGSWLTALGIRQRADALAEFAPQHREALMRARDRLIAPDQMGELFKVMGLTGPEWPQGVGFGES